MSITTWSKLLRWPVLGSTVLPQARLKMGKPPTVSGSSRLGFLKRKRTVRSPNTSKPATSASTVL